MQHQSTYKPDPALTVAESEAAACFQIYLKSSGEKCSLKSHTSKALNNYNKVRNVRRPFKNNIRLNQ